MVTITFITDEQEYEVKAELGSSILEVARENEIPLEGACEGSLACSTCHVVVLDKDFYNTLSEPKPEEEDMLDLAFGLTQTSRLGCQLIVDESFEGIKLRIPSNSRNLSF
jgi:ferredoxin